MDKSGKGLFEFAGKMIGTPYFYGMKYETLTEDKMLRLHQAYPSTVTLAYMALARVKGLLGRVCIDCSGLIGAYRGKHLGSSQLYQKADARLAMKDYAKWSDGVVCYRKGHVGVFGRSGGKYVVREAKGINYGTVESKFDPSKWECGLTFSDMTYEYEETADHTHHELNPYIEPGRTLKKGCKGEDVKWVQFELCEAGFEKEIMSHGGMDGDFGPTTTKCVKAFQKDCGNLTVDGIVGLLTRCALKER